MEPIEPETKVKKTKAWFIKEERTKTERRRAAKKDTEGILVKLTTKQALYAVPGNSISIKENSNAKELNTIVRTLLKNGGFDKKIPEFDFLIDGEILVSTLGQLINSENINRETIIEIEYLEKQKPPKPQDSLQHDDWVSSVNSRDKILLTGCYDNTVQLWDGSFLETGCGKKGHLLTVNAHKAPVKAVTWINSSHSHKLFVSSSLDQTAAVWQWDRESNIAEKIWHCKGHTQSIECVSSQISGTKFATGSWDTQLKIWDADPKSPSGIIHDDQEPEGKKAKSNKYKILKGPLMTLAGHSEAISGVSWMNKANLFTCSWDHSIRKWDLEGARTSQQWSGNVSNLCLSYSPINNTIIVGCSDRLIRLYDPRSKDAIMQSKYGSHDKWVSSIQWHTKDGNLFVSGCYDNLARIWDKRSPKSALYCLKGHSDKVLSVDWTDGMHIVTGSSDCTAKIFSFDS